MQIFSYFKKFQLILRIDKLFKNTSEFLFKGLARLKSNVLGIVNVD